MILVSMLISLGPGYTLARAYPYALTFQHVALQGALKVMLAPGAEKSPWGSQSNLFFERLVWQGTRNRDSEPIRSLRELEGKVAIRTEDAALEFCRLQTSPATFGLFAYGGALTLELLPSSLLETVPMFGISPPLTRRTKWPDGLDGIISDQTWKSNHLSGARVTSVSGGYVVIRPIVRCDLSVIESEKHATGPTQYINSITAMRPEIVTEEVMANGRYRIVLRERGPNLGQIAWRLKLSQNERRWPASDFSQ